MSHLFLNMQLILFLRNQPNMALIYRGTCMCHVKMCWLSQLNFSSQGTQGIPWFTSKGVLYMVEKQSFRVGEEYQINSNSQRKNS